MNNNSETVVNLGSNLNETVTNNVEPVVNETPVVSEPVKTAESVVTPVETVTNNVEPVVNETPVASEPVVAPVGVTNNNAETTTNNNITAAVQSVNTGDDEELLKAFIGKNYDKITTRPFNWSGFFFTTLYMAYRKMIGYGLLFFALNIFVVSILKLPYIAMLFNLIIGLVVNKLYISYAKKKIVKIKVENQQKSLDEIKGICAAKGGTSGGSLALGIVTQLVIALIVALIMVLVGVGSFLGDLFKGTSAAENSSSQDATGTLVENVSLGGYGCFGSKCTVTVSENGNDVEYALKTWNNDLFTILGRYEDYIKLNIMYNQNGTEKTIVNYQLFLKSTNEDISSVKTEAELREKIGLFAVGTHTETLTLKEIGDTGFGSGDGEEPYTYTNYIFTDNNGVEYEMKYIAEEELKLSEGNQYKVTFEVSEGTFEYEYTLKSIEK